MNRLGAVRGLWLGLSLVALAATEGGSTAGNRDSGGAESGPVQVSVAVRSRHSAISLASTELTDFLNRMAGTRGAASAGAGKAAARIELGLFTDFGLPLAGLADPALDDAIHIDVNMSKGIIAGSNPRSVLIAAYRFLEAAGCRWLRPGRDGDYVPSRRIDNLSVRLSDKAAYRFRGDAPDGSFSLDHVLDNITWAPKMGLNTYYSEFFYPRYPHNDYYGREYPSLKKPAPRSDAEIVAYYDLTVKEAKRRDMLFHAVGHGWSGVFVGNPETECDHRGRLTVPADQTKYLAMVNGERKPGPGPTTTDLCYGNPEVQRRLVTLVADYAENHASVDFLHFWLDDRMNDACECPLCRDTRQSDLYVTMLNAIDRELTKRALKTRIVFLIYTELLWPPEKTKIANPDRFALMFAPISRLYDTPYEIPPADVKLPPYTLNKNVLPHDVGVNVGFLREWQKGFRGLAFAYDYHMTWHHYLDLGYYGITTVLAEDIRRLSRLGLQGFVSCQVLRAFYPHAFPLYVNARLLWNPKLELADLAREYFPAAFGADGLQVREYMSVLSDLSGFNYFYRIARTREAQRADERDVIVAKLARIPDVVAKFRPVIARNLTSGDTARRLSWKHISVHSEMVIKMARLQRARAEEKKADQEQAQKDLMDYIALNEDETDGVFDIKRFQSALPRR